MSFESSSFSIEEKLANFSKYVRRQALARFLVQSELFKLQLDIKGSIIEGGVHHGGGVLTWAKLSAIFEPYNYHREVIGFDTFEGFPSVSDSDLSNRGVASAGMFKPSGDIHREICEQINDFDENRFLGEIPKVRLVRGDACEEIPRFLADNPHVLVSLLYLDFDLYEPTQVALETFLPRMPRGAVIGFDEVNNPDWPGETRALLDALGLRQYKLECLPFEPNISFIVL